MWNPRQRISTLIWYMEETDSIFHIWTWKIHVPDRKLTFLFVQSKSQLLTKGFQSEKSVPFTLDVASRNFTPTFLPAPFVFPQSHLLSPTLLQQSNALCEGSWRCPGVQACCHKEAESKMLKLTALRTSVRDTHLRALCCRLHFHRFSQVFSPDFHRFCWEPALGLCCVGFRLLPGLLHEDFEAIWAGGRDGKVEAVTAHSPNDGRRVHILVGNLSREQLPQNHSKWPEEETNQDKLSSHRSC